MDLSAFSGETGSRVLSAALLVLLVIGVGSVAHRLVTNRVADVDLRYRSRKAVMSLTWILAAIAAISQFVDAFEGLGAALGIAGAGVAFALQEVIASAAGWLGIQFGGLYSSLAAYIRWASASSWVASRVTSSTSACCAPP